VSSNDNERRWASAGERVDEERQRSGSGASAHRRSNVEREGIEQRMGFLSDRKILITGLLSSRSIAYGIAKACKREGATLAFTYVNDDLQERVRKLAAEFGSTPVLRCDVTSDDQIAALFESLRSEWGGLDGLLHAIAFAPRESLAADYLNGLSREAFAVAHDVSSYSLAALAKAARPLMQERHAAMVTLTYLGAVRAIPNYNVMGLAKASLEANVRYLAQCLGPEGIRVNGISAGPIKTLAAAGIAGLSKLLHFVEKTAPLRRNVTIHEVGNVAAFLFSDLSSAITGEVTYVDCGFSTVAAGMGEE
jgi:enoyl-[acyl-carrier protein] reductase I